MTESVISYWKKCFEKGKEMGVKKKEEHKRKLKNIFRRKKDEKV